MSVDLEKVEAALGLLKRYYLKKVAKERNVLWKVDDKRNKQEIIDALLSSDVAWEDENYERLLDVVEEYKKESESFGRYVGEIQSIDTQEENPDYEQLSQDLSQRFEEFSVEFDEDDNLVHKGFELAEDDDRHELSGTYWTQTISYNLNPLRKIYERETLYDTNFRMDFENDVIFIGASLPTKANELVGVLEEHGVEIIETGHQDDYNHPNSANAIVGGFVDELRESTLENPYQSSVDDFDSSDPEPDPTLRIYYVEMLTEDAILEEVSIDGKVDIFTDESVKHFIEERGGVMTRVEGKFDYKEQDFNFKAGYGAEGNLGRLSITKRGSSSGNAEIVDECFDFISDIYKRHFIDLIYNES